MSRVSDRLREKEHELADALKARLREAVFENRYSLHPRRLAELGTENAGIFLNFLEAPDRTDALAYGQKLAREGIGEKTMLLVASDIQRFCRTELGSDIELLNPALDAVDAFSSRLLDGFMKAREAQILTDQEQLRRALSAALQSQGEELLIKNHAINTSINGIMLADLDGKALQTGQDDERDEGRPLPRIESDESYPRRRGIGEPQNRVTDTQETQVIVDPAVVGV